MNRSDIVERASKEHSLFDKKDVEEGLSLIISYLSHSLSKGNRIELRGFGSFSLRKRNRRFSRNPKTGESIFVDSKFYLYFRPSKNLQNSINN